MTINFNYNGNDMIQISKIAAECGGDAGAIFKAFNHDIIIDVGGAKTIVHRNNTISIEISDEVFNYFTEGFLDLIPIFKMMGRTCMRLVDKEKIGSLIKKPTVTIDGVVVEKDDNPISDNTENKDGDTPDNDTAKIPTDFDAVIRAGRDVEKILKQHYNI